MYRSIVRVSTRPKTCSILMVRVFTLHEEKESKYVVVRVSTRSKKNFQNFQKKKTHKYHKKTDKILHFTFPHLPHRTLFKVLKRPFKYQLSHERGNCDCGVN